MILTLLFVVVYFPSRPKFAPTASAVTARLGVLQVHILIFLKYSCFGCILVFLIHNYSNDYLILFKMPIFIKKLT